MRRDFSEAAESKLCSQIREINAEQWAGWTDAIGDVFTSVPNIRDYLDQVDDYHKKIMDKNNTTVEKIAEIFADVRGVDYAYQPIFISCRDILREQREYVQKLTECLNVRQSGFTVSGIQKCMAPVSKRLSDARVQYYVRKLRFGNGNRDYDFDYLTEIMNTPPEDVPKELYAALIISFNEMNMKQKERFIECSYIEGMFYGDPVAGDGSGKFQFTISDTFLATVASYTELIGSKGLVYEDNPALKRLVGNYSLMRASGEMGKEIYVAGSKSIIFGKSVIPIDVTLQQGTFENDYLVRYNGSSSPYNAYGRTDYSYHRINTYGIYKGNGIDQIFDEHAIGQIESFRVDIGQKQFEAIASGVAGVLTDVYMGKAGISSNVLVPGTVVLECVQAEIEGNIANQTVDNAVELVKYGNIYKALSVSACFAVCDGEYQMYAFAVDTERLEAAIQKYSEFIEDEVGFTTQGILDRLRTGTLHEISGLEKYSEWYNCKDIEREIDDYLKLRGGK